jgi:hypothetical protein
MKTSTIGLTLALSSVALAGCGHATGSFLPPVKEYSATFQKEMKAELPAVRENAPRTYEFVKDGIKLRDKIRAGEKVQAREGGGFRPFKGLFQKH